MTYRYSIIIPHHNQPQLLQRLLASIPQRTDIQTVVIEDAEGRGAGWARNQGLLRAEGEYVIFADSDDCFQPAFSTLLDSVLEETADIIYFNADSIEEDTAAPSWRADHINWMMKQPDAQHRRELLLRHTFTEPWCHVLRLDFIRRHNLRFDETPIVNDAWFVTQAGFYAERISIYDIVAYRIYNQRVSTGKRQSTDRLLATTNVMGRINLFNVSQHICFHHPRAFRPLVFSFLKGRWRTSRLCYRELRNVGYSPASIVRHLLSYPCYLLRWYSNKNKYRKERIAS